MTYDDMIIIILWIFRISKISQGQRMNLHEVLVGFLQPQTFRWLGPMEPIPKKNSPLEAWISWSAKRQFWDFMIHVCFLFAGGWYYTCLNATDEEKETSLLIVRMCRFPWISNVNTGMSFSTILWIACVSHVFRLGNVLMPMTQLRWRGSWPSADLISAMILALGMSRLCPGKSPNVQT